MTGIRWTNIDLIDTISLLLEQWYRVASTEYTYQGAQKNGPEVDFIAAKSVQNRDLLAGVHL